MSSQYQRVNGRGHRTLSQKAKCNCCGTTYTDWKFIGRDGKCYICSGVGEDTASLVKFIKENQEA